MRRIPALLLVLTVLAACVWTFLDTTSGKASGTDPWKVIPQRAAVIIELPDAWRTWDRLSHTSQLWGTFEKIPAFAGVSRFMARATERMEQDDALKAALSDVTLWVSVTRTGGDQVDLLFSCSADGMNGAPVEAFMELMHGDASSVASLLKGGVIQVRPDSALPELSLTLQQGLWLMATSTDMMDEALLQLKSDTPADTLLQAARNTLGLGVDAHVLLHTDRTKALLNTWWDPGTVESLDLPGGWVAMDLGCRPDALLLSGLLLPNKSTPALDAIQEQGVGRQDLLRWLPATVNAWSVQHVDDAERYLDHKATAEGTARTELGSALFGWVHGSIGQASVIGTEGTTLRWAVFHTDDTELAERSLTSLCAEGGCDTLRYRDARMVRLPVLNAHEKLLGPAYAELGEAWWSLLGEVVVFASDANALRTTIDAWNDGRTLAEDARTNAWTERMASTAGTSHRWDIARSWKAFSKGMKEGPAARYSSYEALMLELGGLSIQCSPAPNGQIHITVGLEFAPVEERSTGVLWSTAIGARIHRKPDIVRNHTNGALEVLVQDEQHRIHLIGSTGKLLWTKTLDSPILGDVHQVDRYKNGKLQLLFGTAERLYLVDRNGKDVGDFPVKLPSKASAPVAVLDYDSNKDYRIIIPTVDGRMLNYGVEGEPVKGWAPAKLKMPSTGPVHHIRIRNKDYLLVADGNGRIMLLDRRGEPREKSALDIGTGARIVSVHPGVDLMSTGIYWSDTIGGLHKGTIAGEGSVLWNVENGKVGMGALGGSGDPQLVHIVGDTMTVKQGGKELFQRTFGTAVVPEVDAYGFGGGAYGYAVILPEQGRVMLLDQVGAEVDGSPFEGVSRFSIADINLDGMLELITSTADGRLVAYRLATADQ